MNITFKWIKANCGYSVDFLCQFLRVSALINIVSHQYKNHISLVLSN